ncbi:Thyroid adenoma-associated protein like [Schistosoma japonicum]|nr:Thyroid adenoma-associated protein like [Schistosoma japonicum]
MYFFSQTSAKMAAEQNQISVLVEKKYIAFCAKEGIKCDTQNSSEMGFSSSWIDKVLYLTSNLPNKKLQFSFLDFILQTASTLPLDGNIMNHINNFLLNVFKDMKESSSKNAQHDAILSSCAQLMVTCLTHSCTPSDAYLLYMDILRPIRSLITCPNTADCLISYAVLFINIIKLERKDNYLIDVLNVLSESETLPSSENLSFLFDLFHSNESKAQLAILLALVGVLSASDWFCSYKTYGSISLYILSMSGLATTDVNDPLIIRKFDQNDSMISLLLSKLAYNWSRKNLLLSCESRVEKSTRHCNVYMTSLLTFCIEMRSNYIDAIRYSALDTFENILFYHLKFCDECQHPRLTGNCVLKLSCEYLNDILIQIISELYTLIAQRFWIENDPSINAWLSSLIDALTQQSTQTFHSTINQNLLPSLMKINPKLLELLVKCCNNDSVQKSIHLSMFLLTCYHLLSINGRKTDCCSYLSLDFLKSCLGSYDNQLRLTALNVLVSLIVKSKERIGFSNEKLEMLVDYLRYDLWPTSKHIHSQIVNAIKDILLHLLTITKRKTNVEDPLESNLESFYVQLIHILLTHIYPGSPASRMSLGLAGFYTVIECFYSMFSVDAGGKAVQAIDFLLNQLEEQIIICEKFPIYGLISLFKQNNGISIVERIISLGLRISEIVLPVVGHESPEGVLLTSEEDLVVDTKATDEEINQLYKLCEKTRKYPEYLILCCWRSVRELSLLMGISLVSYGFHKSAIEQMKPNEVFRIAEFFCTQLLCCRHRGAFELCATGFTIFCTALVNHPTYCTIPIHWLNALTGHASLFSEKLTNSKQLIVQNLDFSLESCMGKHDTTECITRRGAGCPLFVQAILSANLTRDGTNDGITILKNTVCWLLKSIKTSLRQNNLQQFSCLIRNASMLFYSTIIQRIFGVNRSKAIKSRKNCIPHASCFKLYSMLYLITHLLPPTEVSEIDKTLYKLLISYYAELPLIIVHNFELRNTASAQSSE